MKRTSFAILSNALVPGAGLVILRREWSGLATSILFAVFAQIVIFSRWITPLDIPTWASYVAMGGLLFVWAGSMWVVVRRARVLGDSILVEELDDLRRRGSEAIEGGDLKEAHRVLLVALSVNDEDAKTWVIWSELMQRLQKRKAARLGWKRVLQLSKDQQHRKAALEALRSG